ncbi:MAG: hypothetical protein KDJ80_10335 [Nitratireductor sp.]|nr:hypothetical protein [Nitratireductor sp.]
MLTRIAAVAFIIGAAALAVPQIAGAQTPTRIKQNSAWGSFSYQGGEGKVCYILSVPTEKSPKELNGKAVDHGDVFFMLAQHPGQNVRLEPQFTAGYNFQEDSKVVLDIDGKQFSMFTRGQNAWLENPAEEGAVVAAMKAGAKMHVAAVSRRGTQTGYDYSLSGVTASITDITSCK